MADQASVVTVAVKVQEAENTHLTESVTVWFTVTTVQVKLLLL